MTDAASTTDRSTGSSSSESGQSTAATGDTTVALDGGASEASTTLAGSGSSTDGMPVETSDGATTGEQVDCHPRLVEVYYDTGNSEDQEQWVKLYNPCVADVELGGYSLGWGGADYTVGTMDLMGTIGIGECFIVGGPLSSIDNANPVIDFEMDFTPDLEKSGVYSDGVALFLGVAAGIQLDTIPVDAVIYGGVNGSGLLDANGDAPAPHVGDAGDYHSIRRTADDPPTWIIEADPMPELCPPY